MLVLHEARLWGLGMWVQEKNWGAAPSSCPEQPSAEWVAGKIQPEDQLATTSGGTNIDRRQEGPSVTKACGHSLDFTGQPHATQAS